MVNVTGTSPSSLLPDIPVPSASYGSWFPSHKGMIILGILTGYIASSIFFLKFPTLIHRKKKQAFKCTHISHRGGAGENLENTMTAFRHARSQGTEMLELDVHLSLDGEVVVAHDGVLTRTAGHAGRIAETNFADLPEMLESLSVCFGNVNTARASNADRRMPLLREVFAEFPTLPINVDLKENSDVLVRKTSELIKEFRREHLTVWGNARDAVAQKCRRENPNIPMFFSIRRALVTLLLFWTGLLPFLPIKEEFFEICMPSIFLNTSTSFAVAKRSTRLTIWIFDKLMMRKTLIDHLKKRGIQVYIWVLNDEADFTRAFELGATGVMTDFPTLLSNYLKERPLYLLPNHL
ncbi:Glycerophosphodiester phosphodiesterase domain-containing protein 1 [Hypsibius exemplaris]|uniref:Glycerophosphodiester phosphodiesterase domain-containing protein 1 n=1 Tax=Hypsibius exemplaris TaxID=2072580 RepID=A0A1W0WJS4_HYPEX|nr:Glycerophosphodiester phosphodiesterase domain-containing protein 1 [Hypsibius exemplaris]